MIKFCGNSLCKPLEMIFKSCIIKGELSSELKKAKVISVQKRATSNLTTNKLISDNQSGFKPSDSCVNQLLSITHEIYHSLDNGLEVRGVFLDISKASDKVYGIKA